MRWLIRVTGWERVSLWRRIACAFGRVGLLLVLLAVLGALFGPSLTTFFLVRRVANEIPSVSVVPRALTDYSVSDAPGTTLSYFGYSFEVPWTGSFKTRVSTRNSTTTGLVQIKFSSGQDLLFNVPRDQSGLLSEIAKERSSDAPNFGLAFSDLIKRPAYDQYSALLNTSPSTVRPFGPRAEAARGQVLLMIKAMALPTSLQTGAFSFQFPNKRGFQIGDPSKSQGVWLEVLDFDGHYVEILCGVTRNGIRLTQPELNRIIESLRTLPVSSFTAMPAGSRALRN